MAENYYDLDYTGSMVDRILDTGYDLQNQGYIFRGLASHYTGTPTERTWLIAPTGSTGFGLSSPVPPGSIGICMYNGSSWYAEVLNTLTLDTAPTTGSGNGITSGAVKTLAESITNAIGQLEQSVSDRFTSLELEDTTGSLQAEVLSITLKYIFEGEEETLTSLSILAATATKAGLMSAADKQKLDAFVTNIRSLRIQDTTAQADQGTEITNTLRWTIEGVTEAITAFTLYAATAEKAGLMSAADKTALDTLPSLINAGYLYAGIATPSTVPSSTSAKIFYIAIEGGTYTSFGSLNVTQGINILYKSGDAWSVAQVVGIDNEPTAGSDNLVKSGGVKTELALGAVYDVSAHHNGATFESLSALLSDTDLNALIPTAVRKGGMSIKFVQSSDNKYVQYFYMGTVTTGSPNPFLDTANWQGIDTFKKYKYAYNFDGENLLVAYNDGMGVEYCYWFKKCMANMLYTFYQVGYRETQRDTPYSDDIAMDTNIVVINQTNSDNIGPVSTNGGWTGGNHTYNGNTNIKTAKTNAFEIYIDGVIVNTGKMGYCDSVSIKVTNTLFDPTVAPPEGAEILTKPLLAEFVSYSIYKNTIEVAVLHQYVNDTNATLTRYYGMQSTIVNEEAYITPDGEFTTWKEANDGDSNFIKGEYPNFRRFIEKNRTKGYYQSTYLKKSFIGDHHLIASTDNIFSYKGGKSYHWLICSPQLRPLAGSIYQWKGCYTFFKDALVDNNNILVYRGVIDGKDAIYVSVSDTVTGLIIQVPGDIAFEKMSVIENTGFTNEDGNITIESGGAGLLLKSNGPASMIIVFGDDSNDNSEKMLKNREWTISGNVIYDNNDIPQSYDIVWTDGTPGTVVLSNFNDDVFEYCTITATYNWQTIVYTLTYDVNGYLINETFNIQ